MVDRILSYGEDHGFPFAQVKFDSIQSSESGVVDGKLTVVQNRYFEFDTITMVGDAQVSKSFLYQYLGIEPKHAV